MICECEKRNIQIRGLVFDLGNKTFLSEVDFVNVNFRIPNPAKSERFIYLFPDVPHLLKLFRNHCLDKGFCFQDKDGIYHPLLKDHFKKLIMTAESVPVYSIYLQVD